VIHVASTTQKKIFGFGVDRVVGWYNRATSSAISVMREATVLSGGPTMSTRICFWPQHPRAIIHNLQHAPTKRQVPMCVCACACELAHAHAQASSDTKDAPEKKKTKKLGSEGGKDTTADTKGAKPKTAAKKAGAKKTLSKAEKAKLLAQLKKHGGSDDDDEEDDDEGAEEDNETETEGEEE